MGKAPGRYPYSEKELYLLLSPDYLYTYQYLSLSPAYPYLPQVMLRFLILFLLSFTLYSASLRIRLKEDNYLAVRGEVVLKGNKKSFDYNSLRGKLEIREGEIYFLNRKWGEKLEVIPEGEIFWWGKSPFRGRLRLVVRENKILPLNIVDIEDYLRGVVGEEMPYYWPEEALKAQSVVSRTYALYHLRHYRPYDLSSTILHQKYGGIKSERETINRAVAKTRGEVLVRNGELIFSPFHACSGGFTEWGKEVWEKAPSYLIGVPDPFCENSPYSYWTYRITRRRLGEMLGVRVKRVEIVEYTPSGRVRKIKIGDRILRGEELRKILGYSHLRSTLFRVIEGRWWIKFVGKGWGHGVGLCQWGARKMAEKGFSYQDILKFYFPYAHIEKYEN